MADILQEAFALYKRHLKVFVVTAAILFVPASVATSLLFSALTAPAMYSANQMERVAQRMARNQERLGRDFQERLAAGKVSAQEAQEAMRAIGADAAEGVAVATTAMGGLMVALLGILATAVIAFLVYGLVLPLTNGALTIAVVDRVLGGESGWREHWGLLFRRLGKLLSALIPAALLCMVGFVLLVLPGLVLSFFFAFVPIVVLVEGTSGIAALKRSFALVKSDWLRILLVFVVFGVLHWLAHAVAGLVMPSGFVGRLAGDLLLLALMPVPILGAVLVYLDLRRKEGYDEAQLRAEMDALRAG